MDIKDILSVGLTAEDFDICIEGLDALPEKGMAQELMLSMVQGIAAPAGRLEEVKRLAMSRMRDVEKRAAARKDDLTLLKSKLILLKRLLSGKDAIEVANNILKETERRAAND